MPLSRFTKDLIAITPKGVKKVKEINELVLEKRVKIKYLNK